MKIVGLFVIVLSVSGCMATAPSNFTPSAYQLINIEGKPYFLDSRNGVIYKIKKNKDGTFDINEPVGQVGLKDAF